MRWIVLLACLTTLTGSALAQERERRWIDRLLRPDMTLVNSAQDKQFFGAKELSPGQKFETKVFQTGTRHPGQSRLNSRAFFARTLGQEQSPQSDVTVASKGAERYARTQFATPESSINPVAHDATREVITSKFVDDDRPFLAKGTRQKLLSQENHALTSAEVRELLNRNN